MQLERQIYNNWNYSKVVVRRMIHKTIDFAPGMNNPEHQHRSKTNWLRNQQPQGKKCELQGMPSSVWARGTSLLLTGQTTHGLCSLEQKQQWISAAEHEILHHISQLPSSEEIRTHKRGSSKQLLRWARPTAQPQYEEAEGLRLFCLTKRRPMVDLTAAYNHLKQSKTRERIIILQ